MRITVAGAVLPRPARAFGGARLHSTLEARTNEAVVEIPMLSAPGAFYLCGVDRSAAVRVAVSGGGRAAQEWGVEGMRALVHPTVVRVQ